MISERSVLEKAFWCLLFTTRICLAWDIIHGTLVIEGMTEYGPVPTKFLNRTEWSNKARGINSVWIDGDRFDDSFQAPSITSTTCIGNFRGTQTQCHLDSQNIMRCRLNATFYKHEVMVYIGYEMAVFKNTIFRVSYNGPRRPKNLYPGNHRGMLQLYYYGSHSLPRNQSQSFKLVCMRDNSCAILQMVVFAYQANYMPSDACNIV